MMSDGSPDVLALFGESWMKYIGFRNPAYDPSTFDFHQSPALIRGADEIFNPTPDLAAFKARGGKMITVWGWADTALNPQMGIHYYDAVIDRHGLDATQGFYRLFLIPGVAHCSGGYGPDDIDAMTAVINWAEKGIVPTRLPARRTTGGEVRYNREYCSYPATTKYKGSGDAEDPHNHVCTTSVGNRGT
jgi:feruloyl esterase